jgi:hypothetical protein
MFGRPGIGTIALLAVVAMLAGCGSKTEAPAPTADTVSPPAAAPPRNTAPPPSKSGPPPEETAGSSPGSSSVGSVASVNGAMLVQVFYGTDRSYEQSRPVSARFGSGRGVIRYGTAEMSIPPDHRLGHLEAPSILKFEFSENPKKHVILETIDVLPADEYFRQLGDLQLMLTGLEYIDASSVDTGFLGHSYYGDNRSVIADIHYLIDEHTRACKRFSLKVVELPGGSRCVFAN